MQKRDKRTDGRTEGRREIKIYPWMKTYCMSGLSARCEVSPCELVTKQNLWMYTILSSYLSIVTLASCSFLFVPF